MAAVLGVEANRLRWSGQLLSADALVVFEADDGVTGRELWRSDGTAGGTVLVTEIVPGPNSPWGGCYGCLDFFAAGSALYFQANAVGTGRELWRTDGTASGTVLVADIWPGGGRGLGPTNTIFPLGGTLVLRAEDGVHGVEPWLYLAGCGDAVVDFGEECDDGNSVEGDGCDSNCTVSVCGNGILGPSEDCDDGNATAGDCCSVTCSFETAGSACSSDNLFCTTDVCDGAGVCTHVPSSAGTSCRAAGGVCDLADVCDGSSVFCSVDAKATGECRAGAGVCNPAEVCDGVDNDCPLDTVLPDTTPCDDGTFCNGPEQCLSGVCVDAGPSQCADDGIDCTTTCDEAADACNTIDSGHCLVSGACYDDADADPGNDCRECAAALSATAFSDRIAGADCADDGETCTTDQCDGAGTCAHVAGNAGSVCRAAAADCDLAEFCDGASSSCPPDGSSPSGIPCGDDGNLCTVDTCDGSGSCAHESVLRGGCLTAARALLKVRNNADPTRNQVLAKWIKGTSPYAYFGDPANTSDYGLCIFDANGAVAGMTVSPGGDCSGMACWKVKDGKLVKFKDKEAAQDGVRKVLGKASTEGKAKLIFQAKGSAIPPMSMSGQLVGPVTFQIVTGDGPACWEGVFVEGDATKNDGIDYKAKVKN